MDSWSIEPVLLLIVGWYLLLNLATFWSFARDKRSAARHGRRVPERRLHLLELLGGFPAAFMAMYLLRHKCRKPGFVLVSLGASLLNLVVVCLILYPLLGV